MRAHHKVKDPSGLGSSLWLIHGFPLLSNGAPAKHGKQLLPKTIAVVLTVLAAANSPQEQNSRTRVCLLLRKETPTGDPTKSSSCTGSVASAPLRSPLQREALNLAWPRDLGGRVLLLGTHFWWFSRNTTRKTADFLVFLC